MTLPVVLPFESQVTFRELPQVWKTISWVKHTIRWLIFLEWWKITNYSSGTSEVEILSLEVREAIEVGPHIINVVLCHIAKWEIYKWKFDKNNSLWVVSIDNTSV